MVPDAAIVLADERAEYHALVEVDRGTMSIPRLAKKLRAYLGWASSRVWEACSVRFHEDFTFCGLPKAGVRQPERLGRIPLFIMREIAYTPFDPLAAPVLHPGAVVL